MTDQRRHIGVWLHAAQLIEIIVEGFEFPVGTGEQCIEIHAFDYRQVLEHGFALRLGAGRNAETAIADDRSGNAERRRG